MKDNRSAAFFKVLKQHKDLGFDGMVFLAYVAEFEAQGLHCFVSRAKISQDLPISESGARYLIKRLVQEGYLAVKYEGRKRYLSTTSKGGRIKPDHDTKGANPAPQGGTIKPDEGAELNQIRGHEKANTKNHNKETIQINNYKERALNNGYIMEWDADKKAMVRRKAN
jgi:DNA-binding MarR family transcriptional regulator